MVPEQNKWGATAGMPPCVPGDAHASDKEYAELGMVKLPCLYGFARRRCLQ